MTKKTKKEILEEKIVNISSDVLEVATITEHTQEECYFLLKEHDECHINNATDFFTSCLDGNVYPRVLRSDVFHSRVLRAFLIEKQPSWSTKAFYMSLYAFASKVGLIVEEYISKRSEYRDSDLEYLVMFLRFINGPNKILEKEKHYKELYTKEEINIVYKAALKLLKTRK